MIKKKKICISCKNESYIWSKKRCKTCFNKEFPLKSIKKYSEKGLIKKELKKENTQKLHEWFYQIWLNEPHFSELSGNPIGNTFSTCYYHHILPKSKYKEAEFDRENIIILTFSEHQEVESNPTKFEKINIMREKLKEKYG